MKSDDADAHVDDDDDDENDDDDDDDAEDNQDDDDDDDNDDDEARIGNLCGRCNTQITACYCESM